MQKSECKGKKFEAYEILITKFNIQQSKNYPRGLGKLNRSRKKFIDVHNVIN